MGSGRQRAAGKRGAQLLEAGPSLAPREPSAARPTPPSPACHPDPSCDEEAPPAPPEVTPGAHQINFRSPGRRPLGARPGRCGFGRRAGSPAVFDCPLDRSHQQPPLLLTSSFQKHRLALITHPLFLHRVTSLSVMQLALSKCHSGSVAVRAGSKEPTRTRATWRHHLTPGRGRHAKKEGQKQASERTRRNGSPVPCVPPSERRAVQPL